MTSVTEGASGSPMQDWSGGRPTDLTQRLFAQAPMPPAENRPGMNQRTQFRDIFQQNAEQGIPPQRPTSAFSPEDRARAALMIKELTALLQNTNLTASLPAYNEPHLWSTPVDLSAQFSLPAAVGDYQTVITYQVQPGRWARIDGYGVDVADPAFTYDGSILWRIRKNGINVETLADWGQHRGSVIQPRKTFILGNGDNGSGDVFTFEVRRAVAAGAPTVINMALVGYTFRPRFNYEGTKVGITSF